MDAWEVSACELGRSKRSELPGLCCIVSACIASPQKPYSPPYAPTHRVSPLSRGPWLAPIVKKAARRRAPDTPRLVLGSETPGRRNTAFWEVAPSGTQCSKSQAPPLECSCGYVGRRAHWCPPCQLGALIFAASDVHTPPSPRALSLRVEIAEPVQRSSWRDADACTQRA